jgi:large subunit ribosomal protein L4
VSTVVSVVSTSGAADKDVELPDEIFGRPVNIPLIHQVVVAQEAAARQGTHSTKTRGNVRGGGRKPYRQKGTGRARQGSIRAPQYAGGGVVHGPVPRSYEQRTPKKMKAAALRAATGQAGARLSAAVLVVAVADDELTWKSLRNARGVRLLATEQLNTRDVLVSDHVVFTEPALDEFISRASAKPKEGQR